ncbi:DUF3231 family protein [Alkalihalobacillus sp. AL-G]|uniref:DUF3231 family protein n=1 Tax=Alkalihalobacillus sp. AL-G TaxID=2926399 RepID=UPI00272DC4B4|nr:DUF3231 family protein [Alkalihalobacillus sp. AL-G]WLD94001.1 DUF3231 family protein [Alkalihalobacillus sp. AL-G]
MATEGKKLKLTSAEITNIWTAYMNDTAALCQLQYFIEKVEDQEIKPVIQYAIELSETHIKKLHKIFNNEDYPVPYGFKLEEDVDTTAPRLYSDSFVLNYLDQMGKVGLNSYSMCLSFSVREDIYDYFSECLAESDKLLKKANDVLLSKGLYIRSPYLPIPSHIDFVKKQKFMNGYLGERRPLAGPEITNLYANFQRNALGAATLIGFTQVAKGKDVRKFLVRGKEIASKHCEVFSSILREDDITVPMSWDTEVTDSTTYTFSDKIMMFYTTSLISLSVAYYGASMSMSPRRDIGTQYTRMNQEILLFAEDGANIMIKNGWLEEPPRALDRNELAKKNN